MKEPPEVVRRNGEGILPRKTGAFLRTSVMGMQNSSEKSRAGNMAKSRKRIKKKKNKKESMITLCRFSVGSAKEK